MEELFAKNYVYHISDAPPKLPPGLEGFKQFVTEFLSGYTNLQFTIEDQIAVGDKVVTRVTGHSHNVGLLKGTTPSSPEVAANADSILVSVLSALKITKSSKAGECLILQPCMNSLV